MALRQIALKLGVDVDGLESAIGGLKKLKKFAIAGAAAFAAFKAGKMLVGLTNEVKDLGDNLDKTSKQIGINVEALQELRFAAGLAGVSNNEFDLSLRKLQKNAFEAARGSKTMSEDFAKLGVNVKDTNGNLKTGEQLFTELSDGLHALENDSEKVALAQNLMGKSGAKLLPLFEDGSKGIAAMREEARGLGGIMSQDMVDASVKLTDDLFRLDQAWMGIKLIIAEQVMPVFISVVNTIRDIVQELSGPFKRAIQFVKNIVKFFTIILGGLFRAMDQVVDVLGVAGTALVLLGVAFKVFGRQAIFAALKVAAAWVLANLPLFLMLAALALILLLIDDFMTFLDGGESLIGDLIKVFKDWVKEMGGIGGAIGKIFEKIFTNIFGLGEDTARNIVGAFMAIPTALGEIAAMVFLFVSDVVGWIADLPGKIVAFFRMIVDGAVQMASDLLNAFNEAIDGIMEGIFDMVTAFTDAVGLTSTREDAERVRKQAAKITQRQKAASRESRKREKVRVKALQQLEAEGFGQFQPGVRGKMGSGLQLGEGKDEAAAQKRFEQLIKDSGNITVNVDANGQTSPAAIGNAVATKVSKVKNTRQSAQAFASASAQ